MINKEVCQHCHWNSNFWIGKKKYRWSENDEWLWEKKEVWCEKEPNDNGWFGKKISILGRPPKNCIYYFEHQINQEKEKCDF